MESLPSAAACPTHGLNDRMAKLLGLEACAVTVTALRFRGPRLHLGPVTCAAPVDAGICDRFLTSINRL